MAAFSAIMRGMNILLSIAITTGILSGIWGCVAVSLGLLSWAGFLGCTAYFACPQGGLKGLAISAATLLSGVVWAMVIIYGSALAPHLEILGYVITGIVAFLMCIQAKQLLLSSAHCCSQLPGWKISQRKMRAKHWKHCSVSICYPGVVRSLAKWRPMQPRLSGAPWHR